MRTLEHQQLLNRQIRLQSPLKVGVPYDVTSCFCQILSVALSPDGKPNAVYVSFHLPEVGMVTFKFNPADEFNHLNGPGRLKGKLSIEGVMVIADVEVAVVKPPEAKAMSRYFGWRC